MEIRTNLVKREIDIMNEFLTWKKKKKKVRSNFWKQLHRGFTHRCEKNKKNKVKPQGFGKELTYHLAQSFHFTDEEIQAQKGKKLPESLCKLVLENQISWFLT